MASGRATVKAVLSGDTLILMGAATNGPPPELTLTLASLQAPRLARGPDGTNEPFGWASREFLRKLVIGKQVRFKVEYRVNAINRDFGSVWLPPNARGVEENVCVIVAREGWAKVKSSDRDGVSPDLEKMLKVEQNAIVEKKGMYKEELEGLSTQLIQYTGADGEALAAQYKNKLVPALIESIQNGSSMRVVLRSTMQLVNFGLAGVQCPRMTGASESDGPQPYGREAKLFTETRLLHRDVDIKIEGVDKYGNLYGSVVHPSGKNISVEVLREGLGKMAEWSAAFVSESTRSMLRGAEKEAKLASLRVWKDFQAPVLSSARHVRGMVIEVISGDCLIVCVSEGGKEEERRVYLSSLRAPRVGNTRRNEPHAPYAMEAKEFLRHKSIGKTVRVEVEYEKTNPSLGENALMSFASVFYESNNTKKKASEGEKDLAKGINLAIEVVAAGLAEVVRHRPEESKSEYYDELLTAEQKAQNQKKGLWSGKEAPPEQRFTDLCFDATKAKQYLPFLKREKTTRAVVESIYSGTRVKLFIPKENCMINFVIAGIKCPQSARYSGSGVIASPAEPFGEESKLFTKRNVMQRNVTIEIEDMDRGGNAFGPLYIGNTKDESKNFGCLLLREGLAWVDAFSAERTSTGTQLQQAEEEAKKAKVNYWKTYDAQAVAAKAKQATQSSTSDSVLPSVEVSEIVNGTHFFIQNTGDRTCATVEEKMKEFTRQYGTQGKAFELRKNSICAGLFDDGNGLIWNRARIDKIFGDGSVSVQFIDYGNTATLRATRLRPLDASVLSFPPQAKECVLGFIKPLSVTEEFGQDAAHLLSDVVWGHTLSARIHGHDESNRMRVSLYKNNQNVSEILLETGVIRTDRKQLKAAAAHQKAVVDGLLQAQMTAKKKRVCLWRYGDVESDDE